MVHQDYLGVNLMPPQSMHPAYSFVTQQMSPYKHHHHHHHAHHPSHMPPIYHQQVPTNPYYSHRNQTSLLRSGIGLPLPSQVASQQQQQQQQQGGGGQMDPNHNPLDMKSDKSGLMGNDSGVNKMYGSPYLGPNLWEKDQLYSADKLFSDTPKQSSVSSQNSQNNQQQSQNSNSNINFKVESLDIDEFLHENNLNINDIEPFNNFENLNDTTTTSANQGGCLMNQQQFSQQQQQQQSSSSSSNNIHRQTITPDGSSCSPITQINSPMQAAPARSPMQNSIDSSLASSHESYDQKSRKYSEEDLLNKSTQSGGKKSRKVTQDAKQFVPDELKDEKYWARRRKNNLAAKRSRDARRMKENQIALRASYLEREADALRKQLEEFKRENKTLRMKLAQYEGTTNGPK